MAEETKALEQSKSPTEGAASDTVTYVYHPAELVLKGKNRPEFEQDLTNDIRNQLKDAGVTSIKINLVHGRHFVTVPIAQNSIIEEVSPRVFGIHNYARCYRIERDYELLKKKIVEHVAEIHNRSPIKSFKVETSRVDKRYPTQSNDFSRQIGEVIFSSLNIPVDIHNPATIVRIEILDDEFLYFSDRQLGAQGLPIPCSGRVCCLISGGFDSPVAAWMMMRRGCAIQFVHFHSQPYGEWHSSIGKIRMIVKELAKWGGPKKFFAVPIGELQRQIAVDGPEKLRVTLYRRLMVRVAKIIAERQHCTALATGDNLGQVASQTIESMTTIQRSISPMLIMRPLLGFAKEEIIAQAAKIHTKEISILPGGDCCSHMLPKRVATKPSIEDAEEGEKKLDIEKMVKTAVEAAQLIDINDPWNDEEVKGEACPLSFQE